MEIHLNQFLNRCQYEAAKYFNGREDWTMYTGIMMPNDIHIVSYDPEYVETNFHDELLLSCRAVLLTSKPRMVLYYCEYTLDGMTIRICEQTDIDFILL